MFNFVSFGKCLKVHKQKKVFEERKQEPLPRCLESGFSNAGGQCTFCVGKWAPVRQIYTPMFRKGLQFAFCSNRRFVSLSFQANTLPFGIRGKQRRKRERQQQVDKTKSLHLPHLEKIKEKEEEEEIRQLPGTHDGDEEEETRERGEGGGRKEKGNCEFLLLLSLPAAAKRGKKGKSDWSCRRDETVAWLPGIYFRKKR